MGAITDGDIAYLQSLYPFLEIKALTGQQEQLLLHHFRGQSLSGAAEAAGYKSLQSARAVLESDTARVVMEYLRQREFEDVRINRETLTSMLLEAHQLAATAGEKIAAIRELGKLHEVYPDSKKAGIEVNVTQNNLGEMTAKQLQQLSDAKLAELAGPQLQALLPTSEEEAGETYEATAEPVAEHGADH